MIIKIIIRNTFISSLPGGVEGQSVLEVIHRWHWPVSNQRIKYFNFHGQYKKNEFPCQSKFKSNDSIIAKSVIQDGQALLQFSSIDIPDTFNGN